MSVDVSCLAQMFFLIPSAKDAERGGAGLVPVLTSRIEACEKDDEKAVAGGRRGECWLTAFNDSEPGMADLLAPYDPDRGEGRDGEAANTDSGAGDFEKPGEEPPVGPTAGGPYGSRRGDDGSRCAGGDWIEDDSAERMGTGVAAASIKPSPLAGDLPSAPRVSA